MNIHFKNSAEGLSEQLIERAEKKILKLDKFITERNYEAQVFVDVNKESGAHSSNKMWQTSIHVDLAGDRFNAVETADTAEKATDMAIAELGSELRKARTKSRSVAKRGGGVLKRLMRGFK
ncbi:MAG: HPF/RaiA family ribosome-associated protein [Candidatus Paceibacterota bacterium]